MLNIVPRAVALVFTQPEIVKFSPKVSRASLDGAVVTLR
jgi:hypothetical protein